MTRIGSARHPAIEAMIAYGEECGRSGYGTDGSEANAGMVLMLDFCAHFPELATKLNDLYWGSLAASMGRILPELVKNGFDGEWMLSVAEAKREAFADKLKEWL